MLDCYLKEFDAVVVSVDGCDVEFDKMGSLSSVGLEKMKNRVCHLFVRHRHPEENLLREKFNSYQEFSVRFCRKRVNSY